ncbi:MAG: hypothetical protein FWD73_09915 [Polyangiaceae bacterium]|nr:hypothetical protein [Polyangiaceae bacterium]
MRYGRFSRLPLFSCLLSCATALTGLACLVGCGAPPERTRIEDQSRRVAPLPACVMHLPARRTASGTARKLLEPEIVKLIFPVFNDKTRSLAQGALACTGATIFDDPIFNGGQIVRHSAWPFVEQEGDLTYGSGADRLKVVWLRTHVFPDGTFAGPIAIYRTSERFAEVFAVGVHRGQPATTSLGVARMGGDVLVTVQQDGCSNRKEGSACQTMLDVLLPRRGALTEFVRVPVERVAYSARGERGSVGVLEYRMTSVTNFGEDSIHLLEQIHVRDDTGRDFRRAEHERLITVDDSGHPTSSEPPLWDQFVKVDAEGRSAPATPTTKASPPRPLGTPSRP